MGIKSVCTASVTLATRNNNLHKHGVVGSDMRNLSEVGRAETVIHVEYEVLKEVLATVDLSALRDRMCPEGDEVAAKRWETGASNAARYVQNLCDRRTHRLPKKHLDYERT